MSYDVIVIGAGPGGYAAAMRSASLGLQTVLIEKGELGGLCLNRGCIPSKSLILDAAKGPSPAVRFRQMHQKKNGIVTKLRKNMETLLRSRGVELIRGEADLASIAERDGSYAVAVKGQPAPCVGRYLLVATGTAPQRRLGSVTADGIRILTSDELIHDEEIPASLVVIGAGAVGCEFASLYASLGCPVTLLEMEETLLPHFDRELCRELERAFVRRGLSVKTSLKVVSAVTQKDAVEVTGLGKSGVRETFRAEKVLLSVGRDPSGSVPPFLLKKNQRFLAVDASFQTDARGVYGIGDVNGKWLLAHAASFEGIAAAEAVAGRKKPLEQAVPDCVYTDPEVAKVGLTQEEAVSQGKTVRLGRASFGANAKALLLEEPIGFVKLVAEGSSGELLGAHLIGPGVSELIGELAVALRFKATVKDLAETIHPHPTLSEAIYEAALDFCGESVYKATSRRRA